MTTAQALESVLNAWVNGRKVRDGIPLTIRQQAEQALLTADAQATVEALQRENSQLRALVRALPVVRIDLNGAYHDTLLAQPEDEAVKELLRYRASLDATTPDSNQLGGINDMVSKGGDGE